MSNPTNGIVLNKSVAESGSEKWEVKREGKIKSEEYLDKLVLRTDCT
jgi:hypothetical protein